jgi:hypothetical protein
MGHVEDEITPFLKARRAALDPVELGLPNGVTRRRVDGLRREEVVLDAIARALRLTDHEHTFLRNITAPGRRTAAGACAPADRPEIRPQIRELLDAMANVPALVFGPGTDILAWNGLIEQVYAMDFATMPEEDLNGTRMVFLHPRSREMYPDWDHIAEDTVSQLRADVGRYPEHGRAYRVMCELRDRSADFRKLWENQDVRDRDNGVKRVTHPEVGELVLTYEAFELPTDPGQRLCTYTAPIGSETDRKLRALATKTAVSV